MNCQLGIKILLIFLSSTTFLVAQEMYPGDVNNNGIVNGVDFLFLTNVYNKTGPARDNANTTYSPTIAPTWYESFPNGVNHAYADCNGDGKINNNDIENGVIKNFNLQHGNIQNDNFDSSGIEGTPTLLIVPDATDSSNELEIQIFLEENNSGYNLEDLYGLTFDIVFNGHIIATDRRQKPAINFALANNLWFSRNHSTKRHMVVTNEIANEVITTLAISRINKKGANNGNGEEKDGDECGGVGEFTIITTDIDNFRIVGPLFAIENVMLVDANLNVIPVNVKIESD